MTITNDPRNGLMVAAAILAASTFVAYLTIQSLIHGYSPWQVLTASSAPSDHRLQRMGEPVVVALEQYHSEHGVYPACLPEAGISPPMTFFGPWRYEATEDQESCRLFVAKYRRYNFALGWTPRTNGRGGWYFDH